MFVRLGLLLATAILAAALTRPAFAQASEVRQFALQPAPEGYLVDAEFAFELNPRLVEALNNGVPLVFVVEFELTRSRWYWFDEKAASARFEQTLSYNPLLRQYRVSRGPLQHNYSALADALAGLEQVRGWLVLERDKLSLDTGYVAAVRMRLDTGQLPKPFQFTAITDRDWNLSSAWKRMPFTATEPERASR